MERLSLAAGVIAIGLLLCTQALLASAVAPFYLDAYQSNSLPDELDFSDRNLIAAVQNDIAQLNKEIELLRTLDILAGCASVCACYFAVRWPIPLVAAYILAVRRFGRDMVVARVHRLASIFKRLKPQDTFRPIACDLAYAIAPLLADQASLKKWMKAAPSRVLAIKGASYYFKDILARRGFLQVQTHATFDGLEASCRYDEDRYASLLGRAGELFMAKLRYTLYGKGTLMQLLRPLRRHEYYLESYGGRGMFALMKK